jgi:hypothetical protein
LTGRLTVAAATAALALICAAPAAAQDDAGAQLAAMYSPVLELVDQPEPCGAGEPYVPMDIDRILGNKEVALRGPWDSTTVVAIAPTADDLGAAGPGYHLDFPGDALEPGCSYEQFSRRALAGSEPTTYAHVAVQPDRPGGLALQYWFFYAYNDFNNKHEGDWEMIQLVFDAGTAEEALTRRPVRIGYSQHEGAEQADWGDEKLQLVDGSHPVVYPAAGSHANYYDSSLWLGRTAQQGVGCDDTGAPNRTVHPLVAYVPSGAADYLAEYPWLGYAGAWGELQPWVFNGPTGPNHKRQWSEPITWSDNWRSSSVKVPAETVRLGGDPAGFFCNIVGTSSIAFTWWERNRDVVLFAISGLVTVVLWLLSRTRWRPTAPLRLARRRAFGQIVASTGRLYRRNPRPFAVITALLVPIPVAITAASLLTSRSVGGSAGEATGVALGLTAFALDIIALALIPVVVVLAMERIDQDLPVRFGELARATARVAWRTLRTWVVYVLVVTLLASTLIGIPVAIWLAVRWSMFPQVIAVEGSGTRASLRRSARLVRGSWIKTAIIGFLAVWLPDYLGPFVGALVIFALGVDFEIANFAATLAFLCLLPFGAAMRAYLYHDLRVREAHREHELETDGVLPAETTAGTTTG